MRPVQKEWEAMSKNVVEEAKALVASAALLEADAVVRGLLAEIERLNNCQSKDAASALAGLSSALEHVPVNSATLLVTRLDGESLTLLLREGQWTFGAPYEDRSAVAAAADWFKASGPVIDPALTRLFKQLRAWCPKLRWTMCGQFAFEARDSAETVCRVELDIHGGWYFTLGAGPGGSAHHGYRSITEIIGRVLEWYVPNYSPERSSPDKVS